MGKKAALPFMLLLIAGAAGYAWYRRPKTAVGAAETAQATIVRDSIFQAVSCTGRVLSKLDVDIKAKASGQIITLPFDISQTVHKGDVMVELDPLNQQRLVKKREVALRLS